MAYDLRELLKIISRNSGIRDFLPGFIKDPLYVWIKKHSLKNVFQESRACHCNELFVKSNGEVYPCCRVWNRKDMKIGFVSDKNILDKVIAFVPPKCLCNKYSIRAKNSNDTLKYNLLNIELSLECQAVCAMCCVDAPMWKGKYELYDDVIRLINKMGKIDKIVSQGGEILIQKKSLDFLSSIKQSLPRDTHFSVISNANVDLTRIDEIERLFDSIDISIVGFQPETYSKVMGLKLDRTIQFVEKLIKNGKISVNTRFILTPLTFHEQDMFLKWALSLAPKTIILYDTNFRLYINKNTRYKFWDKIIERTILNVKKELLNCDISKLRRNNTVIEIYDLALYGINTEFIHSNSFEGIIKEFDA
ncbi:radical SAM protein [Geobacter pelophilus]|uniref:Radical SAM protein n=1 Tax=Geoanaerobacter pelophilus TaxID=60036 RepID=A0AAW4KWB9_9BACT|nr:radical SAM protein [Geoanaerobacter pelophilus]MBT0662989.1 radical SAM protein [Geoanaerobacter pelophilus]